MKRFSKWSFRWSLAALVLVLMLALPWAVLADQVVNDIDTTIDPALETATINAGGSRIVGFYIRATTGGGDASGCNATGADPATVNLNVPAGVTASPSSLIFTGCGIVQNVTFSSSTVGNYTISVTSVTGGKSGSLWDTAPAAFTLIVNPPPDTTPPTASPTQSPPANAAGWNNTDVTVTWNWTDNVGGSGIDPANCTTSSTSSGEGTITLNATCKDRAGNTGNASYMVKVDKTAPTANASASPGPNANGWNNTNVTVSFSGSDSLSGVDFCSAPVVLSAEGAGQSASGTCTDKAGNVSAPATASGINIDKTAPTFGACPAGGPFLLNSGVQSVGPIAANAAISGLDAGLSTLSGLVDTSSIGTKTITFTAVDNASNTATTNCSYSVIYNWNGFFRPVDNLPTLNVAKAGSAIPVKFSLSGNQGLNIFAVGYPRSAVVACEATASVDAVEETVTAGGSSLSYDASVDQYIYVWKTEKTWIGCRQLVVMLNDGMAYRANFKLSK